MNRRWLWIVVFFVWDANRPKTAQRPTVETYRGEKATDFESRIAPFIDEFGQVVIESGFDLEETSPTDVEECDVSGGFTGQVSGLTYDKRARWASNSDVSGTSLHSELVALIVSLGWARDRTVSPPVFTREGIEVALRTGPSYVVLDFGTGCVLGEAPPEDE